MAQLLRALVAPKEAPPFDSQHPRGGLPPFVTLPPDHSFTLFGPL